jgi:poly-gamma-glutamate synthesis protein (capsule biosynthesis protein)
MTIVNLEGPLTTGHDPNAPTGKFNFKGKPEYAQILSWGNIDAVTLANNLFRDYLTQGVNDTTAALDDVGVKVFSVFGAARNGDQRREDRTFGIHAMGDPAFEIKAAIAEIAAEGGYRDRQFPLGRGKNAIPLRPRRKSWAGRRSMRSRSGDRPSSACGGRRGDIQGKRIVYKSGISALAETIRPTNGSRFLFQGVVFVRSATGEVTIAEDMILPIRVSGSTKSNDFQPVLLEGNDAVKVLKRIYKFFQGIFRDAGF